MKRVLITRAPHQSSGLAQGLRARGIEPVMVPSIEIVAPSSYKGVDAALGRLAGFDWVVFTSANAVEHFHGRWKQLRGRLSDGLDEELAGVGVAAIGQTTARALGLLGIKVRLVPEKAVAESLVEALVPFARSGEGGAARFLLPRAEVAREVLPEALRAAGAEVEDVAVYRNLIPEASVSMVKKLFGEGGRGVDAVTFTSSSSVTHLLALLEVSGLRLPEDTLRISMGPITSKTLRTHGLEPHGEAGESTAVALVEKVCELVLHSKSRR